MHPVLFELPLKIGGQYLTVHMYGFVVGLGFLAGVYVAFCEARRTGANPEDVLDLSFWLLLSGLAGARVMYIIVNIRDYLDDPWQLARLWEGGLVWYGGFIAALAAGWVFIRRRSMNYMRTADLFMPGVALGHAIGRLGCLCAGCCWGRESAAGYPLAIIFTNPEALAPRFVPMHPVQIYEALGELAIFAVLMIAARRKRYDGQVMLMYVTLYPILRSITEIYRGDKVRGFLVPGVLSVSQFISLLVFAAAVAAQVVMLRRLSKRRGV
ncbi:MAG: prolipoprotein diacylglyceryl transferase [Myxococcota bacterium]|jgi:phosphatidylglycerol:prolipoprotein diacylglycerol transferase